MGNNEQEATNEKERVITGFNMKTNKVRIVVIGGLTITTALISIGVPYLQEQKLIHSCNNRDIEICTEILDRSPEYIIKLSSEGRETIEKINIQKLINGENLKTGYTRIINSQGKLTKDMPFSVIVRTTWEHYSPTIVLDVKWRDGVSVQYNLYENGEGNSIQRKGNSNTYLSFNWERVGTTNAIKIINDEGMKLYIPEIYGRYANAYSKADIRSKELIKQQKERLAAEAAEQRRKEELGAEFLNKLGGAFFNSF